MSSLGIKQQSLIYYIEKNKHKDMFLFSKKIKVNKKSSLETVLKHFLNNDDSFVHLEYINTSTFCTLSTIELRLKVILLSHTIFL